MAISKTPKTRQQTPKSVQGDMPTHAASAGAVSASENSNDVDRRKMIAEAAYYRAQQRGFESGHEVEDWLAAENEIVREWVERTNTNN